jgi:hypothetical protein
MAMKTKYLGAILLMMICTLAFSQTNPSKKYIRKFRSYSNGIQESLFNRPASAKPVITTLKTLSEVETDNFRPISYDWSAAMEQFPNYQYYLYQYQKQDANGRDLIQPAITEEMTDKLLHRDSPK